MKYGFIGCGNMGGALASAMSLSTKDILLSSLSGSSAAALAEKLGCRAAKSNEEVVFSCDCVFLGVKPQMMKDTLAPLAPVLAQRRPMLVSMAAGLTIAQIEAFAGCELPVVRIMPNTPVAVGKGMTVYCANELVTGDALSSLLEDLRFSGKLDAVPEKLVDVVGTAAGCSPAYMYMFLEALADGAVACGLPRAKALEYAAQAMSGAAEMVLTSGEHPGKLKDAVCSPGGSTIAGLKALEEHGFRGSVMDAVTTAYARSQELGKK